VAAKFSSEKVSQNDQSMLFGEAKQMTRFQHKNVVRLLGVCFKVTPCCILLELMPNGDVKSYTKAWLAATQAKGIASISDSHLWSIALDSAAGFEYLASIKHVHRDLAARNVVLAADGTAKIGDFGVFALSMKLACTRY
jgi:serine/threonine protein kinase